MKCEGVFLYAKSNIEVSGNTRRIKALPRWGTVPQCVKALPHWGTDPRCVKALPHWGTVPQCFKAANNIVPFYLFFYLFRLVFKLFYYIGKILL